MKPKTYSFEFRLFNTGKTYHQNNVSDSLTWRQVLNSFRGEQDYFNKMNEVTQYKITLTIKGKSLIYGQIMDKKICDISEEFDLISLEEDKNSMNPISTNARMLGACLVTELNENEEHESEVT